MGDLTENFSRAEFACKCGCGFDTVDVATVQLLQAMRDHFERPITITNGCRCQAHNDAVGGTPRSQHLVGRAADIVVEGVPPAVVGELATQLGATYVKVYSTWTHVDTRTT